MNSRYFETIEMLRKRYPQGFTQTYYRKNKEKMMEEGVLQMMERARIRKDGRIITDEQDNLALTEWE